MTDITISPEALEEAARAIYDILEGAVANQDYGRQMRQWEQAQELARAACLAMLKAWPGMQHDPGALVTDAYRDPGKIILPLPTEKTDD
jgi:predicted RNA polymerase sigma factor